MSRQCRTQVVWDDRFLQYNFGDGHPFTERSRASAIALLEASGYFRRPDVHQISKVDPLPDATLESFHKRSYLQRVHRESEAENPGLLDHGDTPGFPGVFEASSRIAAGTLEALRKVAEEPGTHAVNLAGGLHHAGPSYASGFCVFNDLAVGMAVLLREGRFRRIAYLDIDAHHGDGVMYGFYGNGGVLDIDFHQDGRTLFPGTGAVTEAGADDGKGLKVNVPLPPSVGDEAFIPLFQRIVPPLLRDYRPEVILMQCGVDAHAGDPLAHLQYTREAYAAAVSTVHELSHELCNGRLVVVGGGGYTPASVARTLAQDTLLLSGESAPSPEEPLPESWRLDYFETFGESAPKTWGETARVPGSKWSEEQAERLLEHISRNTGKKL